MVPTELRRRYRTLATPWRNSAATDTYGTTASWTAAINSGLGVQDGYLRATQRLNAYGTALSNIPTEQLDRVKANYATVELADGANQSTIDLLGRLRANAPQVAITIQNLETDTLSSDPNLNSEIAVLNKINAANLVGLRNGQDTKQLMVALDEAQLIDANENVMRSECYHEHIVLLGRAGNSSCPGRRPCARMLAYRMP
jgi:hypothetical protein